MIIDYLERYQSASRQAIEKLLIPKISEALSEKQKKKKVSNLLLSIRLSGKIKVNENREWVLIKM